MTELNAEKIREAKKNEQRGAAVINADDYITIPVVVHVIHQNGPENLPDDVIKSQLAVFNEDFGNYGLLDNDPRAVDTKIRFCLAKFDPSGKPTTGIIRVFSPYTDLHDSNEMATKNLSHWDPYKYFNIWIVRSINGESNIQGYSYVPSESGGPAYPSDGLVLVYRYFGRYNPQSPGVYNLGRTGVHEAGHYLDLLHTWGNDSPCGCFEDDGLPDTPQDSCQFFSKPPLCPHPFQCHNYRMIENYMDYSLDACMKLFTRNQSDKMRQAIAIYRSLLVSYGNLANCGCDNFYDSVNATANVDIFPNPVVGSTLNFKTYNVKAADLSYAVYDVLGKLIIKNTIYGMLKEKATVEITGLRPGTYIISGQFMGQKFNKKLIVTAFMK